MVDRQNGFGKQKRKEERQRQRRAKANRSQEKTQEETEKQKRAADLRRYTCFSLTTVAGKTCISLEHVLVESTYVYSTRREPKRHQRICVSAGSHLQSKMSYGTGHPTTNITTDPRIFREGFRVQQLQQQVHEDCNELRFTSLFFKKQTRGDA